MSVVADDARSDIVATISPDAIGRRNASDDALSAPATSPVIEESPVSPRPPGTPRPRDPRKARVDRGRLQQKLRRKVGQAIADYQMIADGDRVMVCLSGGKDSYTMLDILLQLRDAAPVNFEILAVNLDQKQPGFPEHVLPDYLESIGVPYRVLEQDTYSTVSRVIEAGKTTCGLCSRLRRGILYGFAEREGYNRIALGHHGDDIVQTLFLNMFFGSRLASMPPKLKSDDGKNVVIRPLAYCRENELQRWADYQQYPIIPCNLCGSQENLQRQNIKQMLAQWDRQFPGRTENILRSLQNVAPSQLADTSLFDFGSLETDTDSHAEADRGAQT